MGCSKQFFTNLIGKTAKYISSNFEKMELFNLNIYDVATLENKNAAISLYCTVQKETDVHLGHGD